MLTSTPTVHDPATVGLTWPAAFALSVMMLSACAVIGFVMWLFFRKR